MRYFVTFSLCLMLALSTIARAQTETGDDATTEGTSEEDAPLICPAGQYLCAANLCCPE